MHLVRRTAQKGIFIMIFFIYGNTPGTVYSGCDEHIGDVDAKNLKAAIELSKQFPDVTRVIGKVSAWHSINGWIDRDPFASHAAVEAEVG